MNTTTEKYRPESRLIEDPDRLRTLYQDEALSVREIADKHATVSHTVVHEALVEYGIPTAETGREQDSGSETAEVRNPNPDWSRASD
jgi:hypothetical protein